MTIQNPPVLEHGFVVGRYVTAIADTLGDEDRYPDLRPITGRIRFTPLQSVHLMGGEHPATVVKQPITVDLDDQGYIADVESRDRQNQWYADNPEYVSRLNSPDEEDDDGNIIPLDVPEELRWRPGLYLAVGNYRVEPIFEQATRVDRFTIQVTADHTKESPLDLTLAAPIETPPGFTEVVRIVDRVRAEDAADQAESHAATALVYRDEAASSATTAQTHNTSAGESAEAAEGHADRAEQARDQTISNAIEVDTSAGTKVTVGGVVAHYDSGWRDVTSSLLIETGRAELYIRRIGGIVYLTADHFNVTDGFPQNQAFFIIPNGFRPDRPFRIGGEATYELAAALYSATGGELRTREAVSPGSRRFYVSWVADSTLPTSLPGQPA